MCSCMYAYWCRNVFITDRHAQKTADLRNFDHIQVTYGKENYNKKCKKKCASTHAILTPGNKSLTALSLNGMNCTGYKPLDEMVGWHHQFNGHELGQTGRQWGARKPGALQSMALWRVGLDLVNEQQASIWRKSHSFRFERLHLKHKHKLPVQDRCTILDAWGWCTGTTQGDGVGAPRLIWGNIWLL